MESRDKYMATIDNYCREVCSMGGSWDKDIDSADSRITRMV